MKIRTTAHFLISSWAGGKTTQLYISPEDSNLGERNFDWRVSSAVVEIEESEFSLFEGYERILIPLKGSLEMEHETENGVINQSVNEFELARFSGSWKTKGKGKLTDFNLIFKPEFAPKVSVNTLETGEVLSVSETAIYLYQGILEKGNQKIVAPVFILNDPDTFVDFIVSEPSKVISIQL
ncbi:HutD family protein [Fluviicola sp.]|uniref:HutD family protein n=1 Tax=Fluviicola sp. TaxID=1917219 RepID=UPI0026306402|nr:HutD family protein [Fluviicola sp.]